MDIYEAINKRYSVRSYQQKPVEQAKLDRILEAARNAPSANNSQAWKFVVVREAHLRERIAEACEQPWIAKAAVTIAVVGTDPKRMMSCQVPADPVDCSIAMAYMTLAVETEGLGTCWIGHFNQDACKRLLQVPDSAKIIGMLPVGYPEGSSRTRSRKPSSEVVSYEKF